MIRRRPLRILILIHPTLVPPESLDAADAAEYERVKTEYDVVTALREAGHEVRAIGVGDDLLVIRDAMNDWSPHLGFNLLEEFAGEAVYDQNVVSHLELLGLPYTGCCPRGLMLARDKALSKKVMAYHGIRVPEFAVFPRGRAFRPPGALSYPLFVKSLNEEASLGISQASLVEDEARLAERIAFIHERIGTDAIAERYIDGRELYVGVIGNSRIEALPVWELQFSRLPEGMPRVATARAKWNADYQKKWGIFSGPAELPPELDQEARAVARRVYRSLNLTGYARIDLRLSTAGELYVLEANPNPQLAHDEDFAASAVAAGLSYPDLLQRIVNLALRHARRPAYA